MHDLVRRRGRRVDTGACRGDQQELHRLPDLGHLGTHPDEGQERERTGRDLVALDDALERRGEVVGEVACGEPIFSAPVAGRSS